MEVPTLDGRKLVVNHADISRPHDALMAEEGKWAVFEGCDVKGDTVAQAQSTDVSKLEKACVEKEFSGFIVDHSNGTAVFKNLSRAELLANKFSNKSTKEKTLHVIPDPDEQAKHRTLTCVKGEGMPSKTNSIRDDGIRIDAI